MDTKRLLIPELLASRPILVQRSIIRAHFEKNYLGAEIVRLHFLENKCFIQIDKPILEYSSYNRLQFHMESKVTEFDIISENRIEISEA